jgi:hypothetical protein
MGSLALLQSLKESVTSQASVKTLYGNQLPHTKRRSFRLRKSFLPTVLVLAQEAWERIAPRAKEAAAVEEYVQFRWGHRGKHWSDSFRSHHKQKETRRCQFRWNCRGYVDRLAEATMILGMTGVNE